jgi:hypothetical protein
MIERDESHETARDGTLVVIILASKGSRIIDVQILLVLIEPYHSFEYKRPLSSRRSATDS